MARFLQQDQSKPGKGQLHLDSYGPSVCGVGAVCLPEGGGRIGILLTNAPSLRPPFSPEVVDLARNVCCCRWLLPPHCLIHPLALLCTVWESLARSVMNLEDNPTKSAQKVQVEKEKNVSKQNSTIQFSNWGA